MSQKKHLTAEHRVLRDNFSFLLVIQVVNYGAPLLSLGWVVSRVGYEKLGWIATAQAVMTYLIVLTEYGFNLSATKEISVNRHDHAVVGRIYRRVLSAKLALTLLAAGLLVGLLALLPDFRAERYLFLGSFTLVAGQAAFPVWFFQGLERMRPLAYLNLLAKVVSLLVLVVLVRTPAHYTWVNALQGGGSLAASLAGLYYIHRVFGHGFWLVPVADIRAQLAAGWRVFVTNLLMSGYTASNILILQAITADRAVVGYFGVAEKLIIAFRQLLVVFFQATYPHICQQATLSMAAVRQSLRRLTPPFVAGVGALGLLLLVGSPLLVGLSGGVVSPEVVPLVRVMALVPLVAACNMPAYQLLLAFNFTRSITVVFALATVFNVVLNAALGSRLLALGSAWTVLLTEGFITVGLHLALQTWHPAHSFWPPRPAHQLP